MIVLFALKVLYVVLSAIVVFLPLTAVVPRWLGIVPFYRRGREAVRKILDLREEQFSWSRDGEKIELRVGSVRKGELGFEELLASIRSQRLLPQSGITRVGLVYGDFRIMLLGEPPREYLLSLPTNILGGSAVIGATNTNAGYLGFVESDGECSYLTGLCSDTWPIHDLLMSWVRNTSQAKVSIYTAIAAILWVTVTTLLVFQ